VTLAGQPNVGYTARLYDEDDPARGTTLAAADRTRVGENGDTAADANTSMIVQAVGHSANGARVLVEATIAPTILPAIVVNDSLTISGSATVAGAHGDVHSNRNLTISGRVTIAGNATASGTYTASRRSTIGGAAGGGYRTITVSPVRASDHRAAATFVLTSTGRLTNAAGGLLCDASSRRTACQRAGYAWVYQGRSGWAITSDDRPMAGTYYVETDATISGSPGTASDPVQMSVITEGNLIVRGHPVVTASTPGLLFVTDMDLQLSGHLSTPMASEARMLVRGQLEVSSHPTIAGQFLVEGADVGTLVAASTISGSPTILYNGTSATTELTVASWRRVR
jgi:cytoskeletal protein CcmA (bactofilin family)